ncbi:hypothetical protein Tco_0427374 [Tanacetum coccineum]
MNPQEIQQATHDETLVPTTERIKISSTNMRIDPLMTQKEETFQVVLDLIKASPCYNAFLVTADVPEIYIQQFWFTVKKIKRTTSYEFNLADKKLQVGIELFHKVLGICPRVQGEEFVVPPSKEALLTFLMELGYKGQLSHLTSIFGMFHRKNVDFAELIWEDFQYQIDYRLKFVNKGEDFQEYGRAIPDTMLTDAIKKSEAYKAFIDYSTGLIPLNKTKGKGSQGKKQLVTLKKKSLISSDDNIIPKLDVTLELAKSISQTKADIAEEERCLHETHERLVSAKPTSVDVFDGEPANRPTGRRRPSEEQLVADTKKAIKSSKEALILQQRIEDSSEGAGITPEVPDELTRKTSSKGAEDDNYQSDEEDVNVDDITWLSTDEEEKAKGDDDEEDDDRSIDIEEIDDERTDSKNKDQAMTDAKNNIAEKVEEEKKEKPEVPRSNVQIQQEIPPVLSAPLLDVLVSVIPQLPTTTTTPTPLTTPLPTTPITPPPVIPPLLATKVPDASVPPSEALNVVLQRVSTLEKDVKELKKIDHYVVIVKAIKSQVPPAVNEFLRSSLGDSLQKVLQRHTEELKQELKHQESQKCASKIIKNKQEQASKQKWTKHSTTPVDKTAENEYKQKDILFQMMMASKSYERHPAHKELYDALLQSLFVDEDDMDKDAAADQSTQVKRKHDDQDKDPTTGSYQGKEKKMPQKDTQPSNKSSVSKESSKGKTSSKTSKSGKSVTTEEPNEEHVHDVSMDDKEHIIDEMGNAEEQPDGETTPKTDNALKNNWFKQPLRPPTPDLEWNKCQLMATPINFSNFAKNCLKLDKITKVDLVGPVYNLLKGTFQSIIELKYNMEECYKALSDQLYWINPKGDRCLFDLSKPLPLKEEIMVRRADRQLYTFKKGDFINLHLNEIKDMLLLVVQHKLFHLDADVIVDLAVALQSYQKKLNITKPQKDFPTISTKELYTASFDPPGVVYEDLSNRKRLMRVDELYKFSNGMLKLVRDTLHHRLWKFRLGYNKGIPNRKWSAKDQKRSGIMVKLIEEQLLERR